MLFLAVFLGFVAENYREHIVDKEKAKQYMHSMVENLKYDTTRCSLNIKYNMEIAKGIDSFRYQITEAIDGRINPNKLYYYYVVYGKNFSRAVFNEAAITQMQSSGTLSLIKNDHLVTEVLDYYVEK